MPALLDIAVWYLPAAIGLYVLLGAIDSNSRLLLFGARELHLTTVPAQTLATGLLLAESIRWLLPIGPSVIVVAAFAAGTRSLRTIAVAVCGTFLVVYASLLWGTVLGLAGRVAWRRVLRLALPDAALYAIRTLAMVLIFGPAGVFVGTRAAKLTDGAGLAAVAPDGPPPVPLGRYAEFFFFGTPLVDGPSVAAIVSAAAVVISIPLGAAATARVAPHLWYLDPPRRSAERDGAGARAATTDFPAKRETGRRPGCRISAGYVPESIVRRTVREPGRSVHLLYHVVAAGMLAAGGAFDLALLPTLLGQAAVFLGIWFAGAAFGLNPIGEEDGMLSEIVLSEFPPHTFVRARILAGTLVGVPLVALGATLLSIGDFAAGAVVAAEFVWIALTPASAAVGVGVGSLLPQSEAGSVDVPTPDTLAILAHGTVTAVLAVAAGGFAAGAYGLPVSAFGLVGVALLTALLVDLCYRYAVGVIPTYGRSGQSKAVYAVELCLTLSLFGLAASTTLPVGVEILVGSGPAVAVAGGLGWAVAAVVYLLASGWPRSSLRLALPSRTDAAVLGVAGLVSVAAAAAVRFDVLSVGLAPFPAMSTANVLPASAGLSLVAAVVTSEAAATTVFFRGVVQQRLREAVDPVTAVIVTAVLVTVGALLTVLELSLVASARTLGIWFCLATL